MTEEEKIKDLHFLSTKVSNILLAIIENNVKKLKHPGFENNLRMTVALNVIGNIGLKMHINPKEDHTKIENIVLAAEKTHVDLSEWFMSVIKFNVKKGMN